MANTFWFEKNLQGDIVAVYNSSGTKCVSYTYDAWGSVTQTIHNSTGSNAKALLNPFRYRGYYYDTDTGFYYLNSRYYDPATGRFINADSQLNDGLLGFNLFAYCENNPVNRIDSSGYIPKWLSGVLNIVSGVTQMIAGAALGAFSSWTGVGAIAAGFLIINGAATTTQGIGQIINDIADNEILREDNIIKTSFEDTCAIIVGEESRELAGAFYDAGVIAAELYALPAVINSSMKLLQPALSHINGGYGLKIGNSIEVLYQNPNAAGGPGLTLISIKNSIQNFRIDWDPFHGIHTHPPGH